MRLNSPNDLVYKSDGALYFTDPPFGLPKFYEDPRKKLPYSGVFRISPEKKLTLVNNKLKGPNGIAFSPDEKYLYVGNWDPEKKVVMRYEVKADGSLASGSMFFDMTKAPGEDALDGIKVDQQGNLSVAHESKGVTTVFQLPDGKRVLRLTEFTTSNGSELQLYLVAADDASDSDSVKKAGFVTLGALKGNQGDQNYELPAEIDLAKYRAATVWCRRFGVNFATAPLVRQ